jgi:hypothetical protein
MTYSFSDTWHWKQSREKSAVCKAVLFLGDVFMSQGDNDTPHILITVALEVFICMDIHCSIAECLLRLGDLALKENISEAVEVWTTARPLFERSSQAKNVLQIDSRLAMLGHTQKRLVDLAMLHPPETIFEEVSSEVERLKIEEGLGAAGQNAREGVKLSNK